MKLLLVLLLSVIGLRAAAAEDMDLRNRADQLMNRALLASRLGIPLNIRTEVSFTVTGADGVAQAGSYTRIRGADGTLREDLVLGDYNMSRIQEQGKVAQRTGTGLIYRTPPAKCSSSCRIFLSILNPTTSSARSTRPKLAGKPPPAFNT